jgi:hypothetical protein
MKGIQTCRHDDMYRPAHLDETEAETLSTKPAVGTPST